MKNPIESPFQDGKIKGMSGSVPTSASKGASVKGNPKMAGMKSGSSKSGK